MMAFIQDIQKSVRQLPLINVAGLRTGRLVEIKRIADELGAERTDWFYFFCFHR